MEQMSAIGPPAHMLPNAGKVHFRRSGRHAGFDCEMTDLDARAERVRVIVEAHRSKVIDRIRNVLTIEVPADVSISLNALRRISGLVAVLVGQAKRGACVASPT
jgi:hypothetical protein